MSSRDKREWDVVGVDIGGSKTSGLRVAADGHVVAEAVVGSSNIESVSIDQATAALTQLFGRLGSDGVGAVCVGSAGVNTPEQEAWLSGLVAGNVAGASVAVAHDTRLILATAELDSGIAVICGTGSVAWGRDTGGRTARAGGWGYLLGDEGSGYWLACQAVRHALRRADAGLPLDDLSRAIAASVGQVDAYGLLGAFYADPERQSWARRAAVVFELAGAGIGDSEREAVPSTASERNAPDAAAVELVRRFADELVALILAVSAALSLPGPVVLGGGLVQHQPLVQRIVRDALAEAGLEDVRVLDREPVWGAVYLARKRTQVADRR